MVVGGVRRFERPGKLVACLGLNPGQRESGRGMRVKLGVGKRGRGGMRHLLRQKTREKGRRGHTLLSPVPNQHLPEPKSRCAQGGIGSWVRSCGWPMRNSARKRYGTSAELLS
jgi:hypothetical protein